LKIRVPIKIWAQKIALLTFALLLNSKRRMPKVIQIFIAYSHTDLELLNEFRVHATPLVRNKQLQLWFDGEIRPGEVWDTAIKQHLHAADIILLLLSANALHSDYFYTQEVEDALGRHRAGTGRVVPVLLSPCLWEETPLADLQGLPNGMKAVSDWPNRGAAWNDVLLGLLGIIREMGQAEDAAPPLPESGTSIDNFAKVVNAHTPSASIAIAKPAAAEEHAWEFTTDADSRPGYEKFLTRFPQGFYAAEAQARIDAFEGDDTAWEFATDNGTERALQKYLGKYPEGLHAKEARKQVAAFEREREAELEHQREASLPPSTKPKRNVRSRGSVTRCVPSASL